MADVLTPAKALAVNPLKASQPIGASLAFLGLAQTMPLEHGARGCTSFNKLFFMRHFHEPIALQTTAMDQTTTVLGADDSVVEALATICAKNAPEVIGLITTGLSEMQGADIPRTVYEFRRKHPEFAAVAVVPVRATDTLGCLESGFALAVEAIIEALVVKSDGAAERPRQVNVLVPGSLTSADVDEIRATVEAFGLRAIVLPDIADSLSGRLTDAGYQTLTYGGVARAQMATMGQSAATLVLGASLTSAADLLRARTGVPDYRFPGLMGLEDNDAFVEALARISGHAPPPSILRSRARLEDAMVDCQFQLAGARVGIAADPDHLAQLTRLFASMGAEIVAVVASTKAAALYDLPADDVVVGDLEDLEALVAERGADLIVANSHGAEIARRTGAALLRAGFPVYDSYAADSETWVGYGGTRRTIFRVADLLAAHHQEIAPYVSRLRQPSPSRIAAC